MKIIAKINLTFLILALFISCDNSKEKEMLKKVQQIQIGYSKAKVDSIFKTKPKKFIEHTDAEGNSYYESYYELGHPFGYLYNVSYSKKDTLVISSTW